MNHRDFSANLISQTCHDIFGARWQRLGSVDGLQAQLILWIEFDEQGLISGESHLHSLKGCFRVDADGIQIASLDATRRACFRQAANGEEFAAIGALRSGKNGKLSHDWQHLSFETNRQSFILTRCQE